jgi:hypothetical protein
MYDALAKKFLDRATEKGGMRPTVQIQTKKLHAQGKLVVRSEQVEGRGTVYSAEVPPTA